jgi:hypothetical protein
MSTAQERFLGALSTGTEVSFTDDEDREIRADWLANVLSGRDGPPQRHAKGLTVDNAYITGPTDWRYEHFTVRFALRCCVFDDPVEAAGLWVDGDAAIEGEGTNVPSLDLSDARIDGDLTLTALVALGRGKRWLDRPLMNLNSLKVASTLHINRCWVPGELNLLSAEVGGQLDLRGAKVHIPLGNAVYADGANIAGDAM